MPKRTSDFNSWELKQLSDPSLAARYLSAILEEAPDQFAAALGNVARSHQITTIAEQAGTARETLYRSLSEEGNPTWKMLSSVMKVLHVKFKGIEGIEKTTVASGDSGSNAAAKRHRTVASRRNRSYSCSSTYGQLTLAFPKESVNVVEAGTTTEIPQPSAASSYSCGWIVPPQHHGENASFVFNAMLAARETQASIESSRGW